MVDAAFVLTSPSHVKWVMELVGHGFSLPIEDIAIIRECSLVYSAWLLEPQYRPAALRAHCHMRDRAASSIMAGSTAGVAAAAAVAALGGAGLEVPVPPSANPFLLTTQPGAAPTATTSFEQSVWQAIFKHYSLLFEPRKGDPHPGVFWVNQRQGNDSAGNSSGLGVGGAGGSGADLGAAGGGGLSSTVIMSPADVVASHIDICKNALKIFLSAARHLQDDLTEETWTVVLKVVLGVTDRLLSEPRAHPQHSYMGFQPSSGVGSLSGSAGGRTSGGPGESSGPVIADTLCELLMRVLMELWLRSKTRRVDMWDKLKKQFASWTHRVEVVHQWNATILGLTQRVIRIANGEPEGTEQVTILINGHVVDLKLPNEFVLYSWHRMIYIIGNVNAIEAAQNFEVAMTGVSRVVDAFHSIGMTMSNDIAKLTRASVPDGNTLLNMFGGWLFEATSRPTPDYGDGVSKALSILCRIFCLRQRRAKFLRTYLDRFYATLAGALRRGPASSLTAILMSSETLFVSDLEGARILVPDVIVGIRRVLPRLEREFILNVSLEELRRASLKILGTIFTLPNHFEAVGVKGFADFDRNRLNGVGVLPEEVVMIKRIRVLYSKEDSNADASESPTFYSIKPYILDILITSLNVETSSQNAKLILHLLGCFVIEEVNFCSGVPALVIGAIRDKV
ncbi:hypothetical protein HK101_011215 [Irineochytrium annulatum]|nr:hypothetical protein HK101_011215 [Irineochytrium annulatum]